MIDSPDNLTYETFDGLFKRGAVLRYENVPINQEKIGPKYLILLNNNCDADTSFFFLTTSNVARYSKSKFASTIVKVRGGTIFPLDTIINCRQVRQFSRDELRKGYKERKLKFIGELPAETMREIDDRIRNSELISPETKLQII